MIKKIIFLLIQKLKNIKKILLIHKIILPLILTIFNSIILIIILISNINNYHINRIKIKLKNNIKININKLIINFSEIVFTNSLLLLFLSYLIDINKAINLVINKANSLIDFVFDRIERTACGK